MLEAEVRTLQRKLQRRDHEIIKQERELHKLRVRILECKVGKKYLEDFWIRQYPYNTHFARHHILADNFM